MDDRLEVRQGWAFTADVPRSAIAGARRSDRPATEGKKDFDTTQIVSGRLTQPQEQLPPAPPPMPATEAIAAATRAEQNPLPGFEKVEGDNPLTYGSNVAKIPDPLRHRSR